MAKIFITGSSDGLGLLTAGSLIEKGHEVFLHARSSKRADDALRANPGAKDVFVADLSSAAEAKKLAGLANYSGKFDVIIHNAGIYDVPRDAVSVDGIPLMLAVNTLAPYILTSLMHRPQRIIYLSSGMHTGGDRTLKGLTSSKLQASYSDTKFHINILTKAVARLWPETISNAVDPGWVPTKMGGAGAPDNLQKGYETQVWLAASDEPAAKQTGIYFHHKKPAVYLKEADDHALQNKFLELCSQITGVSFPI